MPSSQRRSSTRLPIHHRGRPHLTASSYSGDSFSPPPHTTSLSAQGDRPAPRRSRPRPHEPPPPPLTATGPAAPPRLNPAVLGRRRQRRRQPISSPDPASRDSSTPPNPGPRSALARYWLAGGARPRLLALPNAKRPRDPPPYLPRLSGPSWARALPRLFPPAGPQLAARCAPPCCDWQRASGYFKEGRGRG